MSARLFLLLGAMGCAAVGCDNDSTAPQGPTINIDAGQGGEGGQGGQGGDGGSGISPTPGPGPSVVGLQLPDYFALVTGLSGLASSGLDFLTLVTNGAQPVYPEDMQRVVFRIEGNDSAPGQKLGAIPVLLRPAYKPSPNGGFELGGGFVCASERSGSSGRTYRMAVQEAIDPATGKPYAERIEKCSLFLVEVETSSGKKRYKLMVFWNGVEAYLSSLPSDAASGRRAHFGATFNEGAAFQLLHPDHTGPIPE